MRSGDPITELYPNMQSLNVKPGLLTKFYIDDIRTVSAEKDEKEEDLEDDDEGKDKDHKGVHSRTGKEKRPMGAKEKEKIQNRKLRKKTKRNRRR